MSRHSIDEPKLTSNRADLDWLRLILRRHWKLNPTTDYKHLIIDKAKKDRQQSSSVDSLGVMDNRVRVQLDAFV
ncbi:hypothetical protein IFM89_004749 [Coptis chinensis]|uniref:Uncharacterized protein n=1 Tax=Coptis chinensis TaxID=261450 RepID=A0A835LQG8_9MAGN|nr:hypothetical protein IFM89_004749 [Coptis chinensis]